MVLVPVVALYVVLFLTGRWMQSRGRKGWLWAAGMMAAFPLVFAVGIWSTTAWGLLTMAMLGYTGYALVREIKIRQRKLHAIGFRP